MKVISPTIKYFPNYPPSSPSHSALSLLEIVDEFAIVDSAVSPGGIFGKLIVFFVQFVLFS
jgi:hypothetical protein